MTKASLQNLRLLVTTRKNQHLHQSSHRVPPGPLNHHPLVTITPGNKGDQHNSISFDCISRLRSLFRRHRAAVHRLKSFRSSPFVSIVILMETTGKVEFNSLLDKIQPPRLEDAGLEDCALPPDSIQEAFLKAASAVRSRIFHAASDEESERECVNDPWPVSEPSGDKLVGITTEVDPSGSCVPKKGGELPAVNGDEVVVGGREWMADKVVEPEVPDGAEKPCVDGLHGLNIGEKKIDIEFKGKKSETNAEPKEDDDDEDENIPVLTEVCI